jgi:lipopolysaccharide export system protein LptC
VLSSARARLLLALATVTPVLLYWGFAGTDLSTEPDQRLDTPSSFDFFMRDATTTYWNRDGDIDYRWQTPELRHFPQRKGSELVAPTATQPTDDGGAYKMRANEGWIEDDQSQIALAGDVEVHHNPQTGPGSVLTTSTLNLYPPRDFARTDAPATLTRGNDRTDTVGLEVYFDERRVEMLSNVQGRYDAP